MRYSVPGFCLVAMFGSFLVGGCGASGGSFSPVVTTETATVTFRHFLTTNGDVSPSVDTFYAGTILGRSTVFRGAIVKRPVSWPQSAPNPTVEVTRAGDPSISYISRSVPFKNSLDYNLYLTGETNPTDRANSPELTLVPRDSRAPAVGNIRLHVFNTLTDHKTVDVYLGKTGTERKFLSALSYPQDSGANGYEDVTPTGSGEDFLLVVTNSGTAPGSAGEVLRVNLKDTLVPGKRYLIALTHATGNSASAPKVLLAEEQ